jgi:hypothetical protein
MYNNILFLTLIIFLGTQLSACSEDDNSTINPSSHAVSEATSTNETTVNNTPVYYSTLQRKIAYGTASLAEVRQALSQKEDIAALTNTIHALYGLRWNRGVYKLLYAMWSLEKEKFPELAWIQIAKAPARIALASTINRIQITDTDEYKEYIRAHKNDEHEFHRAQVVMALGFNGDHDDIEYLKTMINADNRYVTQTAITGLALMGSDEARDALGQLWKKHKGNPRAILIEDVLQKIFKVTPSDIKPVKIETID